jgi:hypothetical protein
MKTAVRAIVAMSLARTADSKSGTSLIHLRVPSDFVNGLDLIRITWADTEAGPDQRQGAGSIPVRPVAHAGYESRCAAGTGTLRQIFVLVPFIFDSSRRGIRVLMRSRSWLKVPVPYDCLRPAASLQGLTHREQTHYRTI